MLVSDFFCGESNSFLFSQMPPHILIKQPVILKKCMGVWWQKGNISILAILCFSLRGKVGLARDHWLRIRKDKSCSALQYFVFEVSFMSCASSRNIFTQLFSPYSMSFTCFRHITGVSSDSLRHATSHASP